MFTTPQSLCSCALDGGGNRIIPIMAPRCLFHPTQPLGGLPTWLVGTGHSGPPDLVHTSSILTKIFMWNIQIYKNCG